LKTNSSTDEEFKIKRRSGWSTLFAVSGWIWIIFGSLAFLEVRESERIYCFVAIGIGIQSFFLAFAINAITDIRWFLREISATLSLAPINRSSEASETPASREESNDSNATSSQVPDEAAFQRFKASAIAEDEKKSFFSKENLKGFENEEWWRAKFSEHQKKTKSS